MRPVYRLARYLRMRRLRVRNPHAVYDYQERPGRPTWELTAPAQVIKVKKAVSRAIKIKVLIGREEGKRMLNAYDYASLVLGAYLLIGYLMACAAAYLTVVTYGAMGTALIWAVEKTSKQVRTGWRRVEHLRLA